MCAIWLTFNAIILKYIIYRSLKTELKQKEIKRGIVKCYIILCT